MWLALLDYRTTPLAGINLSPTQLLMGRRPRKKLPAMYATLQPQAYNQHQVKEELDLQKAKQKFYYDKQSTADHTPLEAGQPVSMAPLPGRKEWLPAVMVKHHESPR